MSQINNLSKPPKRFAIIIKYLKGYRWYLLVGVLAVLLSNSMILVNPYLTKIIFEHLDAGSDMTVIGQLVLAMLGLAFGSGLFRFLMRRSIIWMSRRLEYDLRDELMTHLMKLPPSYYDQNRTGDIMARITNDLEAVRMLVGPAIMHMANTLIVGIGAVTMMVILSPELTLYCLVPALALPVIMNRVGNMIHRKFQKIQEHFSHLTAVVQENLAGVRVVKAYRQEDNESAHFEELSFEYFKLNLSLGRINALFFPMIQMVAAALALVILYFGGRAVISGEIDLATIVAFFLYLGMLTWPLIAIGWVISLYQRGTASLDRINSILAIDPEEGFGQSENNSKPTVKAEGKIEFRNLSFSYDDSKILENINLIINPGSTLGIVGPTGCGKTTLVSLIARLYPIDRDILFIDDIDINDIDQKELRRQIGFVPQEPFLFSETVGGNISFGVDAANVETIVKAAHAAALTKDIDDFPSGYDTMVGERGITLSGGQKQRTAIARAIMVEPTIIILDDATSAVDTETEHEINERIHARTKSLTTLIVSHRVSSVKDADQIIYMETGKIIEQGSHSELLAVDGKYSSLYQSQLLAEELDRT